MVSQQGGGSNSRYLDPKLAAAQKAAQFKKLSGSTMFNGTAVAPESKNSYLGTFKSIMDTFAGLSGGNPGSAQNAPYEVGSFFTDSNAYGDPSQMAHDEFAPQYALLDQLRKQTTGKYTQAGNDVGSMYDALAKAMMGEEKGIKSNYKAADSSIGGAYNDAIAATNGAFSQSRNEIADVAKRLGIQSGFSSAVQDGANQQSRLVGLMAANEANQRGLNTNLQTNDVAYNRDSANTTKLAGVNAREDFKSKMLDALAGLDNKQLDIQGEEAGAKNKYAMSIADMKQQAELARQKMEGDQESTALQQARLMLDQSRFGLENDKFLASQNKPAAAPDPSKMNPFELLASTASKLYGNSGAAINASKAIEDTFNRGYNGQKHWNNVSEFIDAVMARNPHAAGPGGDARQLQQLAELFYSKIAGGAGKAY